MKLCRLLKKDKFKNTFLTLDEVPYLIQIRDRKVLFGTAVHLSKTNDFLGMQEAISEGFKHVDTVLVTTGDI